MITERQFSTGQLTTEKVIDFVSETIESNGIPLSTATKINICTDEIVSNILNHSNAEFINVKVDIDQNEATVTISFQDNGKPFNPLTEAPVPDVTMPLEEREEGGLGVFIVKKMMKNVTYQRHDNCNIFTIGI